jgi:hypothetical protein
VVVSEEGNQYKKALSSLGVHPGEAFIIDSNFIQNDAEGKILATLLVGFRAAGVPFVILGLNERHPGIVALNQELESRNQKRVPVTQSPETAVSMLRMPGFTTRAIVTPYFSGEEAARLKKQLEDEQALLVMTVGEFSRKASEMADHFGLNALAERFQSEIINRFFISRAA